MIPGEAVGLMRCEAVASGLTGSSALTIAKMLQRPKGVAFWVLAEGTSERRCHIGDAQRGDT
jgi:hypothetical protein